MNWAFSIVLLFIPLDCVTNKIAWHPRASCSINCVLPTGKSVNNCNIILSHGMTQLSIVISPAKSFVIWKIGCPEEVVAQGGSTVYCTMLQLVFNLFLHHRDFLSPSLSPPMELSGKIFNVDT